MTTRGGRPVAGSLRHLSDDEFTRIAGAPLATFAHQCHAASLAIVKARIYPGARVAVGTCSGVMPQHSWVVIGDPYGDDTPIIDPCLWSYDPTVTGIWYGSYRNGRHRPHGKGSIWDHGRPQSCPPQSPDRIRLTPSAPLSDAARTFLTLVEPLDRLGWMTLAHSPVQEWPAGEIIAAMYDTPSLRSLIPVDIVGMVTDRNPSGLYLPRRQPEGETPS